MFSRLSLRQLGGIAGSHSFMRIAVATQPRMALSTSGEGPIALMSVSDKTGLPEFAKGLVALGYRLMATDGTASLLRSYDLPLMDVADVTEVPHLLGGRVKTLHPRIMGGLLGRPGERDSDRQEMKEHKIPPISLLVVNLYPFQQTVAGADVQIADAIEKIDIGGACMVRAAAKNHTDVAVIVDPSRYGDVLSELQSSSSSSSSSKPLPSAETRRQLALAAFRHTAEYDLAISQYLGNLPDFAHGGDVAPPCLEASESFPPSLFFGGTKQQEMRYGENPHQRAALYRDGSGRGVVGATQVQGKTLSFNNIADADAAWGMVSEVPGPACCIVKHANPCGVAQASEGEENPLLVAYQRAFACDATSAFGGIIAFNRSLDAATAKHILDNQFVEVLLAPALLPGAEEALAKKKKTVRVLVMPREEAPVADGASRADMLDFKRVLGGVLVQTADEQPALRWEEVRVVTEKVPTAKEAADLLFAWSVVKHVKSNAIVFAKDSATVGVGAGQMSRVYSTTIAALKAEEAKLSVQGAVMASDAFFPFPDGIEAAVKHGISAVIQPGGSVNDEKVIETANKLGISMVFTGSRHFRH